MGATLSNISIMSCANDSQKEDNNNYLRKYGWKKQLPDKRDKYKFFHNLDSNINKIDLRNKFMPVYDQGELGSCTANAVAGIYQFDEIKQGSDNEFMPSRLFIYYNERDMEGTVGYDSGATIRDSIKTINKQGVCDEKIWPYDISQFKIKPTNNCYIEGRKNHSIEYNQLVQNIEQLKSALINNNPIIFGCSVYESFESEKVKTTGIIPIPSDSERLLGGHAIVLAGFDDQKKWFIFRNSWGPDWGDNGYGYIPYEYVLDNDLCSDFWIVDRIITNM